MRAPFVQDADFTLYVGDVREVLAEMPSESVDCAATSPPFFGLRDYGMEGQHFDVYLDGVCVGGGTSPHGFLSGVDEILYGDTNDRLNGSEGVLGDLLAERAANAG